jgi:hypothetical protein
MLLDSGCSATLINHYLKKTLECTLDKKTKWITKAGNFTTNRKCEITFTLPAQHKHKEITWTCYVDESDNDSSTYDLVLGRELMHEIGIDICFSAAEVRWDNASIPMKSVDKSTQEFEQELLFTQDPLITDAERIQKIVETKCSPADLNKIVTECNLLNPNQQESLHVLLKKFEHLFDGTLGNKINPYDH